MTDTSVADTTPPAGGAASDALVSPPPPPAPAFHESFQDAGLRDWAAKSGFKSAEDVAAIAHKFDALKDVDPATLRPLPKEGDPNAFVSFAQEHLGAPKEAAAYGLDQIEGVDKEFVGQAQGWFAEAGLTKFQAQHVADKFIAMQKAETEKLVSEDKAAAEREITQLRSQMGEAQYKEATELGRRALKAAGAKAGLDQAAITDLVNYVESGVGTANAIKIFSYFGQFVKEGDFVDGDTTTPPAKNMAESWYAD